ncbi:hypothetical protein MNY27_06780, partial [Sulfurimonas sp. NWX79]
MAQVVATVSSLNGTFYIKQKDGSMVELSVGDKIHEGDLVVGADSNTSFSNISISMQDGTNIIMVANEEQLFDASLLNEMFSSDETVTESETIATLVDDNLLDIDDSKKIETDNIETTADDGINPSDSSYTPDFQEIDTNALNVDINTQLRDVQLNDANKVSILSPDEILVDFVAQKNFAEAKQYIINLTAIANDAAEAATDAASAADKAAATASENPTPTNLAAAESAQNIAKDAADAAKDAANNVESAIITLQSAANAAGEDVDTTGAQSAVRAANAAVERAVTAAADSETTTDAEIQDMVDNVESLTQTANDAAEAATDAASAADKAAATASENPTPTNLAAAESAQNI